MGSGTRLLGKLQDRELGVTRQQQQLLEDDGLCPRGSGGCRGWGLSQAITSITLPLPPKCTKGTGQCLHHGHLLCWEQSGGAGALRGTGWGTAGAGGTLGLPREQPPALRRARCELNLSFAVLRQSPAVAHCPGEKKERPFTCHYSH